MKRPPLYTRVDDETRGRHLRALKNIEKGRLIFAERPLLLQQSLDNQRAACVCRHCKAFIGGPDFALDYRFEMNTQTETVKSIADTDDDKYTVVPCRKECGHLYCSNHCEKDAWFGQHQFLCTGDCEDDNHPLVKFKRYAAETNEILLLVAEWWVAEHTRPSFPETSTIKSPYEDFVMNPWWDVATADLMNRPDGFVEAFGLQESLKQVCEEAAALLRDALPDTLPRIQAIDVAKRIGACEQNAMGIRQRHPLCRDVFDHGFRERCHKDIVRCLEEAGFIGDDACCDIETEQEVGSDAEEDENDIEWDYSVEEITSYCVQLYMDEDGSVRDLAMEGSGADRERDSVGDDLDYIFPPLDGTAMYSLICKMNHSCDPNVIVLYKRSDWGRLHPLTAYSVALKDIAEDDELTISYIESNEPLEQRRTALKNYGFECSCSKCRTEETESPPVPRPASFSDDVDDLFGSDDDASPQENTIQSDLNDPDACQEEARELSLAKRLERLESAANHCRLGGIPFSLIGRISSFVVQTAGLLGDRWGESSECQFLEQCRIAILDRDFAMCKIAGMELEYALYSMLTRSSSWPNTKYREAYWCCAVTASLGFSHECAFLEAIQVLDKAIILGLPTKDHLLGDFVAYIEEHAASMAHGPYAPFLSNPLLEPCSKSPALRQDISSTALQFPIRELTAETLSQEIFHSNFTKTAHPIIIRNYGGSWDALALWNDIGLFGRRYGHRLVPVEIGSMMSSTMTEELTSLRDFVETFLIPSSLKGQVTLADAIQHQGEIAYLAQHPLLDQISELRDHLPSKPDLCGTLEPTNVYMWMGTGGTRTPLHFDSYDNLFVQLVGEKYVRIYDASETTKLYVTAESKYGLQRNMSAIDCENEDYEKHPHARTAKYVEARLLPGDCIFIPSRSWHYVRSLSTSVSINYWF